MWSEVEANLRNNMFRIENETLEFLRDKINIVNPEAERDQWRAASPVIDRFIKEGGETAAAVIDAVKGQKIIGISKDGAYH